MKDNIENLENYLLDLLKEKKITVTELSSVTEKIIENYSQTAFPVVNVGWFAFANGRFSADKNAYADLLGVVAWINPDKNALKGSRGLILLPDELSDVWQEKRCLTNISDTKNGEDNTEKYEQFSLNNNISFPMLERCKNYSKRTGKNVFVPAINQLREIAKNVEAINVSLKVIRAPILKDWIFSSTEYNIWREYSVFFPIGCDGLCSKIEKKCSTRFVISF